LAVQNDPAEFHFAIVADRTGGMRPGVFESAMDKLNLLRPEFAINVGDIIEGLGAEAAAANAEWQEVRQMVGRLQMPFFFVPGNHDFATPLRAETWMKQFGRRYYYFTYHNTLFLCLDTVNAQGQTEIDDEQLAYFRKVLAENPQARWTFVFMHHPLWQMENTGRWAELEKLLANRPHTVFAAHTHHYERTVRDGHTYIIVSVTGGISEVRGLEFGEFDHLVWVTMTERGPVLANLLLDGILDEKLTRPAAKAPAAPVPHP
jgi:3',5'-cyclic AMP phosphodiesterase CpdA